MSAADAVLDYWFGTLKPEDWWRGGPALDAAIAEKFGTTHAALARGEGFGWRTTPEGRLAEIIVLDQFSRQLYRDDPRAFAQDGMALVLAQEAVAGGHHMAPQGARRMFLLMPFMHSESLIVHEAAAPLVAECMEEGFGKSAGEHLDVLRRFGRYPKRNAALGRVSTPAERDYLAGIGDRLF